MLVTLLFATAMSACPIEHARYSLRGTTDITARFYAVTKSRDWPAGVALRVQAAASGRSFWFLPWSGGTDAKSHMAWVREAQSPIDIQPVRRDMEFFSTDIDYNISDETPEAGTTASAHMLIADLDIITWRSTTALNRDSALRAFFDLTACRAPVPGEVPPKIFFPPIP